MAEIIKKYKKFLIKKNNLTRNSHGDSFGAFLFCCEKDNQYFSTIIHPSRNFKEENFVIISNDKNIFKDSLFEGEYYNGVFYITRIIKSELKNVNLDNVKTGVPDSSDYIYSFDSKTYKETWVKKNNDNHYKTIVRDSNFIEIYRLKDTGDIVRVKNTASSKILKNLFNVFKEYSVEVEYNNKFDKWDIIM